MQPSNPWETQNTALAAWLLQNNIPYNFIRIDDGHNNSDKVAIFVYSPSESLGLLVSQFLSGTATGNIPAYYDCYKNLLREVKKAMRD